jgi:(p)ppGpp synthase/HD superfamily hydrolase
MTGNIVPAAPDLLAAADRLAERAHAGQVDKAGAPYIGHPRRVADRVRRHGGDVAQQAAALLHDVLEDSPVTVDDLRAAGVPDAVVTAVVALTRRRDEAHEDAVARAAADPVAALVKRCDVEDNTDPDRLARLDAGTRARLEAKYARALEVLDTGTDGERG